MSAKWVEEYKNFSQETRFVSQLGTFVVSMFAFLSCWGLFVALLNTPNFLNENWSEVLVSITFHLLTGVFFVVRFIWLFFNSKRSFWFGQTFWLICRLTIFAYYAATRFFLYGSFFQPKSYVSFGLQNSPINLLYADDSFAGFSWIYLFTSPIRQIITLIVALIKSK